MPKRLLCLAALSLAGGALAAEPAPPLAIPDLTGPRTLAIQAGIGLATANEALFLNPAALAARKRYVADSFFVTDRRPGLSGSARRQDYVAAAVEDSSTTAVAAGLAYVRPLKGVETGTMLRLGLAATVTSGLSLGVQANYFDLRGEDRISSAINLDAGAFYQVTRLVSVGATAYNLLSTEHRALLPRGYGLGVAAGSETSLQLVADWRLDLDRARRDDGSAKQTHRYSIGAEYLFNGAIPVRAGYQVDDTSRTKWWSAGAGFVTPRVAVDLAYRQNVHDAKARTYGVALRVFVPSE